MDHPWEIWKDIAYPGRVVVPGERGSLVYDFTAGDMARLERTGNAKVSDGWNIPLCWEHQDAEPQRARLSHNPDRDFALGVFGRIKRFGRTPDGRLKALLTGHDSGHFDQLRNVGFVSPEIQWDWTDTEGRLWSGPTVTHLAATARPVQRHQHPIGTDPDSPHPRLAPAGSLQNLVRMSLTGQPKSSCVGARLRLSLDHYTRLPAGASAMDMNADKPADAKKNPWMRIAEALMKAGFKIGTGENVKDADHLADLIEVAAMNSEQNEPEIEDELPLEEEEPPPPPEGDMPGPPPGASEPPPPPVQMSLPANQKLVAMHRKELVRRAERLGAKGYVPPHVANDLVADIKKIRLSLTANADLAPSDVAARIVAYEKLEPGKAWSKDGKTPAAGKDGKAVRLAQKTKRPNATEVPRSTYQEDGEQDTDTVVEAYEKIVGRG